MRWYRVPGLQMMSHMKSVPHIEPAEVISSSPSYVTLAPEAGYPKPRRVVRLGDCECYLATWAEARAHILGCLEARVDGLERELEVARGLLRQATEISAEPPPP